MATLTFTSRTASTITVTIGAGGGETAFELEVNRSSDFASDESLVYTGLAAGAKAVNGLPADTTFAFRVRKTNAGNGAWTTVLLQATDVPTSPAPYTGYSIEPAILVVPEELDQITCAQADAGSLVTNLMNDDPLSVLRSSNAAPEITFHNPGRLIDTFALLGSMADDAATWRIRGASSVANLTAAPSVDSGVVPYRVSTGIGRRAHYHAYRRLATPSALPWWRINVTHNAATWFARHLVVGLARQSVNYSRGAGSAPMDLGSTSRTQFGAPDRVMGWRGRLIDFGLSWLSEAEYEAKWSPLDMLVGGTKSVLALPNPKANLFLNDRIAYGEISQARGENVRDAKWSKTLEIRSLY